MIGVTQAQMPPKGMMQQQQMQVSHGQAITKLQAQTGQQQGIKQQSSTQAVQGMKLNSGI